MPTGELRPTESRDRAYVESLLAENDLPTADLDAAYSSLFVYQSADGERVGVGGLQTEDDAGLLRSVAVEESARGAGYGTAICERLIGRARAADLEAVFLLTTTAAEFFADLGFEETDRSLVPERITATTEFSHLCPASATCMKLKLS